MSLYSKYHLPGPPQLYGACDILLSFGITQETEAREITQL